MKKITWNELEEYLQNNEKGKGVIVFKQGKDWKREFSEEERSYVVHGDNKWFKPYCIGCSLFGTNLTKTDCGVRLDLYMRALPEDGIGERWIVDYCYILEDGE